MAFLVHFASVLLILLGKIIAYSDVIIEVVKKRHGHLNRSIQSVFLILLLSSCAKNSGTPSVNSTSLSSEGDNSHIDAEALAFLEIINTYRAQNGAGPLKFSNALQEAAQWMSADMAANKFFNHTDSLGRNAFTRMAAFGYPHLPAGENLGMGYPNAQPIFDQLKNACDADLSGQCTYAHRMNMLDPHFKVIGIGRAQDKSFAAGWFWTTDFGGTLD